MDKIIKDGSSVARGHVKETITAADINEQTAANLAALSAPLSNGNVGAPNFEQIAGLMCAALDVRADPVQKIKDRAYIVEQLRQVWNARGAADANLFIAEHADRWIVKAIQELDR